MAITQATSIKGIKMWKWYKVYDLNKFDDLSVPDITFSVELQDKGQKTFRLLKGFLYSVIVDGLILTPKLNDRNGFHKGNRSAYIDENNNLWIGYAPEN